MQFELFDVENYDNWGNLIKKWARDKNSRPAEGNIQNLIAAMNAANVGATFPQQQFTTFKFVEMKSDATELVIMLPPPDIIDQAEASLANGYALPPFYEDTFNNAMKCPSGLRKVLHSQRVGEYVLKFCA